MLKTAINRPVSTLMAFLALLLFGAWSISALRINLYPSVNIPLIKITTIVPQELSYVESKVTKDIEDAIAQVSGIDKISSKSLDNLSIVVAKFQLGRDLEQAASDIREKLGRLGLPTAPSVEKISSDAGVVVSVFARAVAGDYGRFSGSFGGDGAIGGDLAGADGSARNSSVAAVNQGASGEAGDGARNSSGRVGNLGASGELGGAADLTASTDTAADADGDLAFMQLVDDVLQPAFARSAGVGEVKLRGFYRPKIAIELDKTALAKYSLSPALVAKIIKSKNQKISLGELENGYEITTARADFAPLSPAELADLQLLPGVFLRDVARVHASAVKRTEFAAFTAPGVIFDIYKISGSDTLKAAAAAKATLERLRAAHPGVEFAVVFDKTFSIHKHMRQVIFDMVFGVILTVVIVFFFLRSASATLLASIAIPVSIIASFGLIYLFGYDLNRLTLIALTLAIGIFVDDAIVVIERIVHRAEAGTGALQAAYGATREIAFSVFAISVVLLCVFVPISFMNSIPGLFFNTLGMSVSFGIVISFLTCIFLVPTLAARALNPRQSAFAQRTEKYFVALEDGYARALNYVISRKAVFGALIIAACLGAAALVPRIGLDFLPMEDDGELLVEVRALHDLPLDLMSERALALKEQIAEHNQSVEFSTLKVAYDDAHDRKKAQIYLRLKPLAERLNGIRQKAFVSILRSQIASGLYAGTEDFFIKVIEVPKFEGAGVDDPVQFVLLGDDLRALAAGADELKTALHELPGMVDITDSQEPLLPAVSFELDALALSRAGIAAADVAAELHAALASAQIGWLINDSGAKALHIRLAERSDAASIDGLAVFNARGEKFWVKDLLREVPTERRFSIDHQERERAITITAGTDGISLGAVKSYLDAAAAPVLERYGLRSMWLGFAQMLGETVSGFLMVVALAAVLIYLVLAALYESFIMPLIIMLTMPLAFVGAATALYLAGFSFSLFVLVALILLFGMVGKNAILLIDVAMHELRAGRSANEALIIAGRSRIRAILMTTLAMIGAMAPLALSHGSGYEANAPMAVAVIGGLVSSTLLTLFVIPLLFSAAAKADAALRRLYEREQI